MRLTRDVVRGRNVGLRRSHVAVSPGYSGPSVHSYRHAGAQRAKACCYPQRFAKKALGHRSRAIHEVYANGAIVICPPNGAIRIVNSSERNSACSRSSCQ